ncbi:LPP20 family lipoprotein [Catenovulum maritimum]|uniref:LPP20 family lipoprotein n=1 Tax=Catenovulum maritimum TaxID=1513271 RepID=UPI00065FBC43|nr:LPP20 family lipoprotein [Catenovulum maritimum]
MKSLNKLFAIFILLSSSYSLADDVIKETATGGINWSQGTIYAHGYGVAPADKIGTSKARLLARRAAQLDAYRNLAEMVQGVRVNSQTIVQEMMVASDTVKTQVEAVIKGAQMIKDHYQNDVATVTMEIPMSGNLMSTIIPNKKSLNTVGLGLSQSEIIFTKVKSTWGSLIEKSSLLSPISQAHAKALPSFVITTTDEAEFSKKILLWLEQQDSLASAKLLRESIESFESHSNFTGLLIDASNVADFEIAAVPTIRNESGEIIYPTSATKYDDLVKKRPVSYDFDVNDAIRNVRVAIKPLVVKANKTYKARKSDLVISDSDAIILSTNKGIHQVMHTAGVMVVVAE